MAEFDRLKTLYCIVFTWTPNRQPLLIYFEFVINNDYTPATEK